MVLSATASQKVMTEGQIRKKGVIDGREDRKNHLTNSFVRHPLHSQF